MSALPNFISCAAASDVSKTRAYALFTLPANRTITPGAERRLKVLQIARYARRRVPASPRTISTFVVPAISSATNNPAISRK